jgi:formylglycine-generating enzyme required for sulfatase activity
VSASRLGRIAACAALFGGCADPEERPQVVVHLDTDAPVPPAPGAEPAPDRQPALFDTLRLEVLAPDGGALDCDGCVRHAALDEAAFAAARISFGAVGAERHVLRATLYAAERIDAAGQPLAGPAVAVAVRLARADDEVVHQRVSLEVARAGIPAEPAQPDPPRRGQIETSAVGSWSGAARTPCAAGPRADTGVDDGEVCVAGGAYVMGSRRVVGQAQGLDADRLRIVSITPLYLDVHEYSVRRFRRALAMGLAPPAPPVLHDPSPSEKNHYCTWSLEPLGDAEERHPLTCVSWELAAALCAFEGRRLPTEAEWEFEATGRGEGRDFPWGDALPACSQAVFARAGAGPFAQNPGFCVGEGRPEGHAPVGSAPGDRSVSGALDLAGGVGEWTADMWNRQDEPCWVATTVRASPLCETPSPADGALRSIRGGAWTFAGGGLLAARRYRGYEKVGDVSIGFRCARSAASS